MNIEILANISISAEVYTVDDLRELVGYLNKYNVPNGTEIEVGVGSDTRQRIWISPVGDDAVKGEWVECGGHIPPARAYDFLVPTHGHPGE